MPEPCQLPPRPLDLRWTLAWPACLAVPLGLIQTLSLDVVAGVLGGAALAAGACGAAMPAAWWLVLPAATWTVYGADRWLDARRVGPGAHTERHRFFWRHHRALGLHVALVGSATGVLAVLALPRRVVVAGAGLAVVSGLYLGLTQRGDRRFPKECVAAAVYAGGIWLGPWLVARDPSSWTLLLAGLHGLAALTNLWLFAWFEAATDAADGHGSAVRSWGAGGVRGAVAAVTALGLVAALGGALLGPAALRPALLVLVAVLLAPEAMLRAAGWFGRYGRHRLWGDLVFLLLVLPYRPWGGA